MDGVRFYTLVLFDNVFRQYKDNALAILPECLERGFLIIYVWCDEMNDNL